jgi:hypothetical protein
MPPPLRPTGRTPIPPPLRSKFLVIEHQREEEAALGEQPLEQVLAPVHVPQVRIADLVWIHECCWQGHGHRVSPQVLSYLNAMWRQHLKRSLAVLRVCMTEASAPPPSFPLFPLDQEIADPYQEPPPPLFQSDEPLLQDGHDQQAVVLPPILQQQHDVSCLHYTWMTPHTAALDGPSYSSLG